MSKNHLFAAIACAALLFAGCGKTNPSNGDPSNPDQGTNPVVEEKITSADFVGTWIADEEYKTVFNADGTCTQERWGERASGTWSYNEADNTITITVSGESATLKTRLIGGKAWLVLITDMNDMVLHESFRKEGAKVDSGTLGDGRWDAPHTGVKPAQYTEDADYRLCLLVSGKNIDLYVPMWGYHIQGTFTLNDGKMRIEADDDHIWAAKEINVVDSVNWSFGWNAWGDGPDDGPGMNPETFELNGYTWYTVNELKKMGHKPEGDADFSFEAAIWNAGQQVHDEAMELCNFDLCVSPDGKEAFGSAVGLTPWFYKR